PVCGARDGFFGLIRGDFVDLDWHELVGWINRPSSEIGTARFNLEEDDVAAIAENIRRHNVRGLIVIGGWGSYLKVAELVERREDLEALKIPMVLIPATIDNNLPCTEFCIGSDTALNNITEAVDKIRHTAGATRRAFIVEVMGKQCGFLALLSALATGAEKAYLPEKGISLAELNGDVENLKRSFERGKRMVIFMHNEQSSFHYTTDFIRRLMEEESKGQFEVRTAILGHVQRGGVPTAFDRILASRMGAKAAFTMMDALNAGTSEVTVLGLSGRGITASGLPAALREMDVRRGRPKREWFMQLLEMADALAKLDAGKDAGGSLPVCNAL
ncbi:MAG: 6-phosphofructokinase, partial [Desulfobacteraceae bacterium]|nr:6-phosphofructokinase [Desulfobacteraceae bacterium]